MGLFMVFALCSCVKPDERQKDGSLELRSLKAFVYYDENDLSVYEEVDLLSGMYLEDKGLASYTFPSDADRFNSSTLKRCRLEATVPSTAKVVLTDENGTGKGCGLDGWFDLYNAVVYFNVVADDGNFKNFKITTHCL